MMNINKYVMQIDESDCGIAALATILRYFNIYVPYHRLKALFYINKSGTSMNDIISISSKHGLRATGLNGSMEELLSATLTFPIIAHVLNSNNMYHFIIIRKIKKNKVYIFDPGIGKYSLEVNDFSTIWTGNILLFEKKKDFKIENKEFEILNSFKVLYPYADKILFSILFSLVISAISILAVNLYRILVDEYIIQTKSLNIIFKDFYLIILASITLYIVQSALSYVKDKKILNLAISLEFSIKEKFHQKINELSLNISRSKKTGEIITRIDDIEYVSEFLANSFLSVMLNILMGIIGTVLLIQINHILFLVVIFIMMFYLLLSLIIIPKISYLSKKKIEKNALVISTFKENIDGLEFIKTLSQEPHMIRKMNEQSYSYIHSKKLLAITTIFFNQLVSMLDQIGMIIILAIGGYLIFLDILTFGQLLAFESLMAFFIFPIKALIDMQVEFQQYKISYYRLLELMEGTTENYNYNSGLTDPFKNFHILVEDISYSFLDKDVFSNLSFEINMGEKIILQGKNGSGKSTIGKILIKMLEPNRGCIYFNKVNYQELSVTQIRKNVIYVPQDTVLFSGTLKENILLGENSEEQLDRLIHMGLLDSLLIHMELGLATYINEIGSNLSGGQKQLIGIVRALVKNPKCIIFDESTSQMDQTIERVVLAFIFNELKDTSCIFISHDEQVKKMCKKNINLDYL